jgi:NAD(P)-dependent dehydrogenase (short-subunit alcohol dehydrogenase family)
MGGFKIMDLFDLTGRKAIVTGGLNGLLGPIWVKTLEQAGASVEIADLPEVDLTKTHAVKLFADNYLCSGIPDILVNNSAVDNPPGSKASFFGNCFNIVDVNLIGAVRMCEQFIPSMIKNGGGVIINIGSIQGYGGADHRNYEGNFEKPFGYNASKWALRGLAKSITTQYGRYGIRAVTISFGPYDGGKLKQEFLDKFLYNVPLGRTISKKSLQTSLLYACCCPELAGQDWRIDGGLGSWA